MFARLDLNTLHVDRRTVLNNYIVFFDVLSNWVPGDLDYTMNVLFILREPAYFPFRY